MNQLFERLQQLWRDEAGAVMSTEYLILGTILTIGLVAGISAMQDSILAELEDYAAAILGIDCGGLDGENEMLFIGQEEGAISTGMPPP